MSPSDADRPVDQQLEEVAAELYALRPDEFVAARDERVKSARASGDAALARQIGRLRRPTQAAWLVNALWRDQQDQMQELFELADEFRRALSQGKREALQELTGRRRALETALLKRARALADEAGVAAGGETLREVQETLASALSDADVAAEVRTGRLVKPVTASSFGAGTPDLRVLPGGKSRAGTAATGKSGDRREGSGRKGGRRKAAGGAAADATAEPDEARPQDDPRLAAAEERVRDAEDTLAETEEELARRTEAVETATARHAELRELVARMEEQLRDLEKQLAAARSAVAEETRRRDLSERARRKAQDALEKARARLDSLT
ncbi:MAG TPA: hypothetical protein VK028_09590 [Micromonosporaceae bacterium]|nr:hypothetical protein [Micromonosporaceae bacterium]